VQGRERILAAGETLTRPAGVPHLMWNDHDEEARTVWQTRPALRTEAFFEVSFGLARDGLMDAQGRPPLLMGAQLLDEYRDVFCPCMAPPAVQRVLFAVLARIGRTLGPRLPVRPDGGL
jgi:hypothetical protein